MKLGAGHPLLVFASERPTAGSWTWHGERWQTAAQLTDAADVSVRHQISGGGTIARTA